MYIVHMNRVVGGVTGGIIQNVCEKRKKKSSELKPLSHIKNQKMIWHEDFKHKRERMSSVHIIEHFDSDYVTMLRNQAKKTDFSI